MITSGMTFLLFVHMPVNLPVIEFTVVLKYITPKPALSSGLLFFSLTEMWHITPAIYGLTLSSHQGRF